jgi:hypothetical protein
MNPISSKDGLRLIKSLPNLLREGLSNQETIAHRNAKCQTCEYLDKSSQRCKLCGCYVWAKMRVSAAECPDKPSRWKI